MRNYSGGAVLNSDFFYLFFTQLRTGNYSGGIVPLPVIHSFIDHSYTLIIYGRSKKERAYIIDFSLYLSDIKLVTTQMCTFVSSPKSKEKKN